MNDVLVAIGLGAGAFIGTMVDNFFAFGAQLVVTPPKHWSRIRAAHVLGLLVLIGVSGAVGGALSSLPLRIIGFLCIMPIYLAIASWRGRNEELESRRRGAATTFAVTVALGGDNLAVWIPLLRAQSVMRGVSVAITFVVLDLLLVTVASLIARHPRVMTTGQRWAPRITPPLYLVLAVVIMWQCNWLSFLN